MVSIALAWTWVEVVALVDVQSVHRPLLQQGRPLAIAHSAVFGLQVIAGTKHLDATGGIRSLACLLFLRERAVHCHAWVVFWFKRSARGREAGNAGTSRPPRLYSIRFFPREWSRSLECAHAHTFFSVRLSRDGFWCWMASPQRAFVAVSTLRAAYS